MHFPKISYTNFLIDREKNDRFIACQSGVENGRGDGRGNGRGNGRENGEKISHRLFQLKTNEVH